jgi:GH35 family endo-1,4-beta-xylanase
MNYLFLGENNKNQRSYIFLFCICMLIRNVSVSQTLQSAANNCGLNMGTAVADAPLQSDLSYQNTLKQEYGMVVPENAMRMSVLKPTETGAYDYASADRLITFAQTNGMKVRGHVILSATQIPAWVKAKTWTKPTLSTYLKDYITNVVGHFKNKITEWDVANEFIDDNNNNVLRNSIWFTVIGESVLDSAFKWVNQADPAAKLFYNDHSAETMNSKSTAVYNLVSRLKSRGAPIHGVGLQMHKNFDEALTTTAPLIVQLDQNIKRIGALGLQVSITELDIQVPVGDTTKYGMQATSYSNILKVALANSGIVKSFVTWGFADKYSWITCRNSLLGNALPFNTSYSKKSAYNQLMSVLQTNCSGIINTPPTVSLSAPATNTSICSGTSITITASASDVNGTITKVEFFDGTTLLGTVTTSPYTYNWANAALGSHNITALASDNGNATATSAQVTITVNAASQTPTVTTTPINYCLNATATALSATGTSLLWYTAATGGIGSSTAPVPVTTTAGTSNYYVSQNTNGCESLRSIITVTVNTKPATPTVVSPVTLCQNTTATALSATGTSLLWYTTSSGGTGSGTPPVPTTGTPGTTNYYVSQTSNGCESSRATLAVTVTAAPSAPTVSTPVSYCLNATATALTATGTSLLWYTASSGGTGSSTAPIPGTGTVGTSNYYVSQTTNACESPRATIAITVNAIPSAPTVSTPLTYCQNATATALAATGTSLKWYTGSTGGTGSVTAPVPSTTTTGTTNYYVSQTISGCESTRAMITVTISATTPAPTVSSPVNLCQNASAGALTATGTALKWYTVSSGGTGSSTAPIPATTTTGTTNYYVSQTAGGCTSESPRAMIAVTVNALPPAPTVSSPVNYCQNAAATALSATGADLKWYTLATGGSGSTVFPTPVTTAAGSTNYYVSQTLNGCEGARATLNVTVNPLPTASITAGGPTTFPQGGSVVLSANTGTGLNYKWFNSTTQVGTNSSYTATMAGNYTVEVTNAAGCKTTSSVTTVTISSNLLPTVSITAPASGATFTAPASITITATASDADGTITKVEFFNGNTLIGTSTASPYSFTWTGVAIGSYTITAVATDNIGTSVTSSAIIVTVNPVVVPTNQLPVVTFTTTTSGTEVIIDATATDHDGTISLVEYLDGNILIGTSTTEPYTFTWTNVSPGTHVVTVRVTDNNGGVTTSSPATLTVTATGILSSSGSDGMKVYPNPSKNHFYVETTIPLAEARIRMIDSEGSDVQVPVKVTDTNAEVDVSLLRTGAYTLLIEKDGLLLRKKIVVVR